MTHTQITTRTLNIEISEINSNSNVLSIALKMMIAFKKDNITSTQFQYLINNLLLKCDELNISSQFEIAEIF